MQLHDSQVQPWDICDDTGKQILFSRGAMISVLILDERNTLSGANKYLFLNNELAIFGVTSNGI